MERYKEMTYLELIDTLFKTCTLKELAKIDVKVIIADNSVDNIFKVQKEKKLGGIEDIYLSVFSE